MMNILTWICLLLFQCSSMAKFVSFISDSQTARENQGSLVTKFTFQGSKAKARLQGNDTIGGLYFFPRDKMLSKDEDCNRYLKKASFSVFPKKGEFKERVFSLSWSSEPVTYFVLFVDAATCHKKYPTQARVSMELELFSEQQSGGHLSVEENGLKTSYTLLLLLYVAASIWFGPSLYSVVIKGGQVISAIPLFLVGNSLQLISLLLPLVHWVCYEYNGWGYPVLLSITTLTGICSDLAMMGLIADVVVGSTLSSNKRVTTSKSEQVHRVVIVLAVVHVIMHFYTDNMETVDPTYYSYCAIREILLSLLWVVEACYFLAVLAGTYQEDRSPLRKEFYASFAWILLGWSLSRPFSHLLMIFITEYNRLKTFVAVVYFLRWCSLVHLGGVFTRKQAVFEVNELSAAFLPFSERTNNSGGGGGVDDGGGSDQSGFYYKSNGGEKLIKRN